FSGGFVTTSATRVVQLLGLVALVFYGGPQPAVGRAAQQKMSTATPAAAQARWDLLGGAYGEDRENNDLISYPLDIRVDPEKKYISGKNTIRFKMLKDGRRIHLDLNEALKIDKILLVDDRVGQETKDGDPKSSSHGIELKYSRDSGAVFVDFPETLRVGQTYASDFYY